MNKIGELLASAFFTVFSFAAVGQDGVSAALPSISERSPILEVRTNKFYLNGQHLKIRGIQLGGTVAPLSVLKSHSPAFAEAQRRHSPEFFAKALRIFNANTVRVMFSQHHTDPESSAYSQEYVQYILRTVSELRAQGVFVIVACQWQWRTTAPVPYPLPNASTVRTWRSFIRYWADDKGVMLELYKEPGIIDIPSNWGLWRDGGWISAGPAPEDKSLGNRPAYRVIGFQELITTMRKLGAKNILILDGLRFAKTLSGAPTDLSDQLLQSVYAVHPYFSVNNIPVDWVSYWDRSFGDLSKKFPVISTEWFVSSNSSGPISCVPDQVSVAKRLLNYHEQRGIGLVAFAVDIPGTIVSDFSGTPNSFANFECGKPGGGAGVDIQEFYRRP